MFSRRTVLAACFASALLLSIAGAGTVTADSSDFQPTTEIDADGIDELPPLSTPVSPESTDTTDELVVISSDNITEERVQKLEDLGADVVSKYQNKAQIEIESGTQSDYTDLDWVDSTRPTSEPVPTQIGGEGAEAIGADKIHEAGVTGEDVSVAVIDTGFNLDSSQISSSVAGYEAFGVSDIQGTNSQHGTASAEVVLDVAPDADLYFAAIGTSIGYANALDWAVENDVDVITASISFYGQPNDGTGFVSRVSDEAVSDSDAVLTASTGNEAQNHWQGEFSDDRGNGLLEFEDGFEVNYISTHDGQPHTVSAGTVIDAHLTWDEWDRADSNYNLAVVHDNGEEVQVVESATHDSVGSQPHKRINTQAPVEGYYGIVVEKTSGEDAELQLFEDNVGNLLYRTQEGSIKPPALAEKTMGVGAFRYDRNNIETYSSQGPTNDGRQGVTVAAPTCATTDAYSGQYCGTSGAAPHAAGTAALIQSVEETTYLESQSLIEDTADAMPGGQFVVGAGRLNASGSVNMALDGLSTPANFELDVNSTNSPIQEGETLTATVTITNSGEEDGTQTVTADIPNVGSDAQSVDLDGGSSTAETFEIETAVSDTGTHPLTVETEDDSDSTEVTVTETDVELPEATVSVSPETVSLGETGDTGDTTVTVEAEEGVASADVTVSIDTDAAVIEEAETGDADDITEQTDSSVTFGYSDPGAGQTELELGDVTFAMTEEVEDEVPISVEAENVNTLDEDDETVAFSVETKDGTLRLGAEGFASPLIDGFDSPPTNTGELDDVLFEDLNGDGDGTDVSQTVQVFGELIRGNDLGLTDEEAALLDWNDDSPEDEVTVADMVSLFGEQIRA